ncbi:MAG TPA: metallophosphoesterase [Sphingomonadaceae bacterium]|nr:metallophosphoesterase [Sphingomonadaceae bacterium]
MRMLLRILLAFLAAAAPVALQAADEPQRIVAVGDLHGDYEAYLEIVEAAGLSDRRARWTGGETVLVQLGDITDRGPDSRKIIEHLMKLEREAADADGQVIVLVGNHEAMNVQGDLRYVHPGEYAAFETKSSRELRERIYEANRDAILAFYAEQLPEGPVSVIKDLWLEANPLGKFEHRLAWAPDGELGKWLIGHQAIAKVGDTLFVHGGISVETAARPLETVNAEVTAALAKGESYEPSILTDELGPLWYRGNVVREPVPEPVEGTAAPAPAPPRPSIEDELAQVLEAYGASRLVVAHTPRLQGIAASHGGRLVRVDTGISASYGGLRTFLEIVDGKAVAHYKNDAGGWVSENLANPGDTE